MKSMQMGVAFFILLLASTSLAIIVKPFPSCTECRVQDIEWPSPTTAVLITDNTAWRSVDEGQTWSRLASSVYIIFPFRTDSQSFVLYGTDQKTFYTSSDGGATIQGPNTFPATPSGFFLHRYNVGWILISYCSNGKCSVKYTKNWGVTWADGPQDFFVNYQIAWGPSADAPDTIFGLTSTLDFGYTSDYGKSWKKIYSDSIGFVHTDNFLFVGRAARSNGAYLYSSADRHDATHTNPKFYVESEFPFGDIVPQTGYTFLDDTTRAEYIGVRRNSTTYGSVFISGFDGVLYSLSLDYVAQTSNQYDFDRFEGLSGVYFANSYDSPTDKNKKTKITYNNGAEWRLLAAPTVDYYKTPTQCNLYDGCSLHLHGTLSWRYGVSPGVYVPPFYSSPNAIGLLVGVGNIGKAVSDNPASLQTYFSRDAGLTWTVLFPEQTIYEFGDHGGILIFATISAPTTSVYYSTDEGLTASPYKFTDTAIIVDNIINEPAGRGQKFILYGHTSANPTQRYIYGIDFSDAPLPTCSNNDYETWSPSDGEHGDSHCFMGATYVYSRRKQASQCFNDRDADHLDSTVPCACTFPDYECDQGFSPSARNSSGGFSCTVAAGEQQPACTSGYRKVPDTQCANNKPGALNLQKECAVAGPSGGGGSKGATAAAVIIVLLVVAAGIVGGLYWKHDGFRGWVQSKMGGKQRGYGRVFVTNEDEEAFLSH